MTLLTHKIDADTPSTLSGAGKGTLNVGPQATAIALAGEVWSACFKTNFIPFWLHAESKNVRLSRIDSVQHAAIHHMSAATRLCQLLPEKEQLRIQRLAISNPASGTMSIHQVASLLNFEINIREVRNAFRKTAADIVATIGAQSVENAARFLYFARVAWIREQVFVVNLSDVTTRRQAIGVLRRALNTDSAKAAKIKTCSAMPTDELLRSAYETSSIKATHLCVCTECERIANAFVERGSGEKNGKLIAFNELGCTQSMVDWTTILENTHGPPGQNKTSCMHCSKRSSTALRSSIVFEKAMMERQVEGDSIDANAIKALASQILKQHSRSKKDGSDSHSPLEMDKGEVSASGTIPRMRRDCKTAFEQRPESIACTDSKMLTIALIGKAVRMYGAWYTHCESCAAIVKLDHAHRYGDQICCLRCDASTIYSEAELQAVTNQNRASEVVSCRFCGAIDPQQSGIRWRRVKAPHDVAGTNATKPVPLRTIYFCGRHYKSWITSACKSLPTRTILAHLALGAKPVFQSTDKRKRGAEEEGEERESCDIPSKRKQKQRKLPKAKL